jgi:glycosyltransferase involved in cell wall biosynthesis
MRHPGAGAQENVTVLYFADTRFPIDRANGAQTMATCRALALRGHDVRLIVRPDTSTSPRDPFDFYGTTRPATMSIETIGRAPGPALGRIRFLAQAAGRALTSRGVVFTRDLGLAAFLLQLPGARHLRVVYESHGIADVVSAEMPRLLGRPDLAPSPAKLQRLADREARVWRGASAYVAITQALAHELHSRFGDRSNVYVVPDGGPEAAPLIPASRGDARPVVGYAGHLYPWKGVDVLIHALAALPDVDGLVVGGHPAERDLARVEALATTLQVRQRVQFTGQVSPGAVAAQLAAAAILVLPNTPSAISERYTSPLKLFEYMALGRPIIASDLPAIREVLTDGETAVLVAPGDPVALAAAIRRLVAEPALAARLASAAHRLSAQYTWDQRAARLETALVAAAA